MKLLRRIANGFQPRSSLTENEVTHGLRMLTWEGALFQGFHSITTTGFLTAYALALGANSFQIGILAALPFMAQAVQVPAIILVDKLRWRKAIAVLAEIPAYALWLAIACIPLVLGASGGAAITALLVLVGMRGAFLALTNIAWSSWVRDLVPQTILCRFYSRFLIYAAPVGAVFGLGASLLVGHWSGAALPEQRVVGYSLAIGLGAVLLGLSSVAFMARAPEPITQPEPAYTSPLLKTIGQPLRDLNFRRLLLFLGLWSFSLNLAAPFFSVYMLRGMGLSLTTVVALGALGQIVSMLFFRVWGPFADGFGVKVTLSLAASLYLMAILGWVFVRPPGSHVIMLPLLVVLHLLAGAAAAGVTTTIGTIGMKLAPRGTATPYLAAASIAMNSGAGLGPLVGGLLATFFAARTLSLDLRFVSVGQNIHFSPLTLSGLGFLFMIAFLLGLVTLRMLASVKEPGEVSRQVALDHLLEESRILARPVLAAQSLDSAIRYSYARLRRVPGLDVAVGFSVYEVAASINAAAAAFRTFRARRPAEVKGEKPAAAPRHVAPAVPAEADAKR